MPSPGGLSQLSKEDKRAILENAERYRKAVLAADWKAWGEVLADDFVILPANMTPLVGRAAAVAWVQTFPTVTDFQLHFDDVEGVGDISFQRGTYTLAMELPDGTRISDRGVFLAVRRRQPDGTWLLTRDMFHSTEPVATQS